MPTTSGATTDARTSTRPTHAALSDLQVPLAHLTGYHRNPRRGNVDAIADSLTVNGQYKPITVNRGTHTGRPNEVLAGNHTMQAARQLGWSHIAATYVDVDDTEAARIVLADNRTSDLASYDTPELTGLLADLHGAYDGTGWTPDDAGALLDTASYETGPATGYLTDPDDVPEPTATPHTRHRDLWQLGPHRLICADSTDPATLTALLPAEAIDLVFTDPPYGMSYGGGRSETLPTGSTVKASGRKGMGMIENDDLTGDRLVTLVASALRAATRHRRADTATYVCFTWRTYAEFLEALHQAALTPKACIVWDKGSIGLGHAHYRPQHEFLFYVPGAWRGDKAASDIWAINRDARTRYVHPTQKPVELILTALKNSSRRGDIVYDAFGGSGSTMIAAHVLDRRARLAELDPRYCDVIARRYQEFTGDLPVLHRLGADPVTVDFTVQPLPAITTESTESTDEEDAR